MSGLGAIAIRCLAVATALLLPLVTRADAPKSCQSGARSFYPCDLTFEFKQGDLPDRTSVDDDELISVEFRSPAAVTYRLRGFWSSSHTISVRFTPTEAGSWTTRISSSIKRFNDQQSSFPVADSGHPGMVSVANVRHWRTTNKQPHLWLSADIPLLEVDAPALARWLDERKRDGFTHVRTSLLTSLSKLSPLNEKGEPNFRYFDALDQQILSVANRGFTLDLLLADASTLKTVFQPGHSHDALVRYLIARYGALNAIWEGVAQFENQPGSRELLREIAAALQKYDAYNHPRSTDAQVSSSPLLPDGWMSFLMEAAPRPEVGAVEHQFSGLPQIHVVTAVDPVQFRNELWNCTANGEYPTISYEGLKNQTNVRAVQTWQKVMADTRHWEFEPYFEVSGARAVGLDEVEYVTYAPTPGIVEISLPKHKYNPLWINPATGEELPLKDYRGEVFSRQTPSNDHDWILQVPRNGHKESMRSYRFDSVDPPVQEVETDPAHIPFTLVDPPGDELNPAIQAPFSIKLTRANRATRTMQYLWWGEVLASGEGPRLLGVGASGTLVIPKSILSAGADTLNLRVQAINANGKAYEIDKVYRLR